MVDITRRTINKAIRNILLPVLIILEVFVLSGCEKKGPKIVLVTDFSEDVVFKIEDEICTKPEVMVYLVNTENIYDSVFGEKIWHVPFEEGDVEDQYKETILARLAQIKAMNLYARELSIELSESDEKLIEAAADEYYGMLTEQEKELLSVNRDTIYRMYTEYAMAEKLYEHITEEINPEISDDEARTVTVRTILIKTYSMDAEGNRIEYGNEMKNDALKRAYEIKARIDAGEEFEILAADYNEDEKSVYSFARDIMPEEIEKVAFDMDEGEVSGVIATEYGYHILKCITNFDKEQTDLHKIDIVEKRKQQAFTESYDSYISKLTSNIDMDMWNSISYERQEGVTTTGFFAVYDRYFK